jgi:hypothetical protein
VFRPPKMYGYVLIFVEFGFVVEKLYRDFEWAVM